MNGLSIEGKRLALSALDITIMATLNNIRIKGAIPMERRSKYLEKTLGIQDLPWSYFGVHFGTLPLNTEYV
jgi:hypothetical protein